MSLADSKVDQEFALMLVQQKVISQDHLKEALGRSRSSHQPLMKVLFRDYGLDESRLYGIFSHQVGLKYVDLKKVTIDPKVIRGVPVKIAWHYKFMPLKLEGQALTIAVDYPMHVQKQDEVRLQLGYRITQVLGKERDILEALKHHYGLAADTVERIVSARGVQPGDMDDAAVEDIDKLASDASVTKLVNEIILEAHKRRATDIHLEPYRSGFRLRYRIDGVLQESNLSDNVRYFMSPIKSRIKIMANLDIVQQRLPQDGRAIVKVKNHKLDLRVSSIPTPHGESIVIRILPTQMIFDFKKLGFSKENIRAVDGLIQQPNGVVFLTGPTGSGKTTTLYACLNKLNATEKKIITIEDPIEYELAGITQIQVMPKIGFDFAKGLRSILRHDPDIMMVGEVRDRETAEIAIRSALTGHLVFSTLHTNDAASAITRLLDIGLEPFLVASSVEAIIAQRLIRTLCPHCKTQDRNGVESLKREIVLDLGIESVGEIKLYKGKGCDECGQTGFLGRIAIHEFLRLTDPIKALILEKASALEIKAEAIREGMLTLRQDGWKKVIEGLTTPDEVIGVAEQDRSHVTNGAPAGGVVPTRPGGHDLERRLYTRIEDRLEVAYRFVDEKEPTASTGPIHVGTVRNLGAGGLMMHTQDSLRPGEVLDLKFKISNKAATVHCLGRVVRADETEKEGQYAIGLVFLDLSSQDRSQIESYVRRFR